MNDPQGVTIEASVAWGVIFLALIAMTDIPATATIAAGFAWLLLVSILLKFGPDAFNTITSLNTTTSTAIPPVERTTLA